MMKAPLSLPVDVPQGHEDVEELPCDRWVASSALQKAIRRGDSLTAQRAATNLYNLDKRAIWRRLLVIAFEDIGAACPQALIELSSLAADPELRAATGGDRAALLRTCARLAAAPKDRSTDYLIAAAVFDPMLAGLREACRRHGAAKSIDIACDLSLSLAERAVGAWHATGYDFGPAHPVGKGDLPGLVARLQATGCGDDLLQAVHFAARRTREPITVLVPLLWSMVVVGQATNVHSELVGETPAVDGVPLCALDSHTRMGRQSIQRYTRECLPVERFIRMNLPGGRTSDALRVAVFFADSALLNPRLNWDGGAEIERLGIQADFYAVHADPSLGFELINLVRENLDHLDAIRADLMRKARG